MRKRSIFRRWLLGLVNYYEHLRKAEAADYLIARELHVYERTPGTWVATDTLFGHVLGTGHTWVEAVENVLAEDIREAERAKR